MKKSILRLLPFLALLLVGCDGAAESASEFVPIDPHGSSETSQSTSIETSSEESNQETSSSEASSQETSSQEQSSGTSSETSQSSEESYNTDVPTEVAQIVITSIKGYNDTWLEVKYDNNPFNVDNRKFSYLKVNNKRVNEVVYEGLIAAKYFNVQVDDNNLESYTFDFYDTADNKYATGAGTNSTYDPGSGGSTDGYETNGEGQYIIPLTINNRYGDGYLGIGYTGDPFEIGEHTFDHFMVDGEAITWSEWEPLKAAKYFNIKVSDNTKESYKIDFYDANGIYATGVAA